MSDELDKLESQADAELSVLARHFDVPTPGEVTQRARLAARIALDEQWLSEHSASEPLSPELRDRLRRAVHEALAAEQPASAGAARTSIPKLRASTGTPTWLQRNSRGISALAAAAMIALCVGIAHFAGSLRMPQDAVVRNDPQPPARQATDATVEVASAKVEQELQKLEEAGTLWADEEDQLEASLRDIADTLDSMDLESASWSSAL